MQPYNQAIPGPQAWTTRDIPDKEAITFRLGESELAALDGFLSATRGRPVEAITRSDLASPVIGRFVAGAVEEIRSRSGAAIIAGCSRERHSEEDMTRIFWGIGCLIGRPISQSVLGDLIGHVQQVADNPNNRTYRTNRELVHHTDTPDVIALMCLQKAKSGGLSSLVSALAIHNEMLARDPALLAALYRGFPYHRLGQEVAGQTPVTPYDVPVYSAVGDQVSVRYVRHMMRKAAETLGRPMPDDLVAAMARFDELAERPHFRLQFMMEPGEIMLNNNYTVLHARTEFEDHPEPERKRHLLRLWMDAPSLRTVVPEIDPYQQPASGGRGGVAKQVAA